MRALLTEWLAAAAMRACASPMPGAERWVADL